MKSLIKASNVQTSKSEKEFRFLLFTNRKAGFENKSEMGTLGPPFQIEFPSIDIGRPHGTLSWDEKARLKLLFFVVKKDIVYWILSKKALSENKTNRPSKSFNYEITLSFRIGLQMIMNQVIFDYFVIWTFLGRNWGKWDRAKKVLAFLEILRFFSYLHNFDKSNLHL